MRITDRNSEINNSNSSKSESKHKLECSSKKEIEERTCNAYI